MLLTTKNSDDLEIRVPDGSRSLKVTPVNSSCIISYLPLTVPEAVFRIVREMPSRPKSLYFATPLAFNVSDRGVPWDDLGKILLEGQRIAKVHSGEEILQKVSIP